MKLLYTLGLATILFMAGCSMTDNSQKKREQLINQMNPNQNYYPNQDVRDQLKFVRYQPEFSNVMNDAILQNKGFDDVVTLVTHNTVLIAYQKNKTIDSKEANDFVWKTAEETFPSPFNIYVTDQKKLFNEICVLQKSQKNSDDLNKIDNIIQQIKN